MHANRQMKMNVDALLRGRRLARKDLADWCRRSESWISKIMILDSPREFPLKYWDKIADFFGISTYQLIQPGVHSLTERRKGQRRTGVERRVIRVSVSDAPTFSAQSLIREVLSLDDADLGLLRATIAEAKRSKIAASSRLRSVTVPPSNGEPGATAPPNSSRARKRSHQQKPT